MKKLMAANWKRYKLKDEAGDTAEALVKALKGAAPRDREVLICPPFTALRAVRKAIKKAPGFALGGQNFFPATQGAFTGEIAPEMLADMGCSYALAGHSERRHILGEDDAMVGRKVGFGLKSGLSMILCVGEKVEEREAGQLEAVLRRQIEAGLADVAADVAPEKLSVAYEPVWAIGTGMVATPQSAQDAANAIRDDLKTTFGQKVSDSVRILYGGSVTSKNAAELISQPDVDGFLIGGAALDVEELSKIARLALKTTSSRS